MLVDQNLTPLTIEPDAPIGDALRRLNATPHLVQLVIDPDRKLVGIITDGDIRRALVAGATLTDPVARGMQTNPVTGTSVAEAVALMQSIGGRKRCVPVIDGARNLVCVVCDSVETPGLESVVVMAGGFGRRQGALTRDTPKPLLTLAGRPILWHLLKDLEESGLKRVFLTIHYLGSQIREFVHRAGLNLDIEFIEEREPLGTAGGLSLLPKSLAGPLLIMNGDIVTRTNFAAMMLHHQTNRHDLTIGAARHDVEVPFGVLRIEDDGLVSSIDEKPQFQHFVSAGIYIIESSVLRALAPGVRIDMPELIGNSISSRQRVGAFPIHEYWLDLGRPIDLRQAEDDQPKWLKS